ncbi:hypothetical protein [Streptomyces sp. NPDC015350]|uniref:hypothetical protein n=1 Tax=Streptomyces sp. NPDC015350 TaxID=3364955 RepID=UPI0036FFDBC7
MLSDEEAINAVLKLVKERGETLPASPPAAAEITWHCLLEGKIVRCIENRTEKDRFHAGPLDLSDKPVFNTTIAAHRVPPPRDPSQQKTLRLVRRGSVEDRSCDCGNGIVACQRCKGSGDLHCETRMSCTECRGIDSCLKCNGTGSRANELAGQTAQDPDERTVCKVCGALDAACSTCRGRGHVECATCRGAGLRPCPDCTRAGTVPHQHCAGTGRTVTWTEGVITRRPHTETVKLPQSGVPYFAWQNAREQGAWGKTDLTDENPLPSRQAKILGSSLKTKLAEHDQEIARNIDLNYLPLARVAVTAQPHRVYYVIPTSRAPYVLLLPSQRRAAQIAAVVCGVLLLLAMISRLIN